MKVLIVSHNALATDHAIGKTLSSLFSKFKKDELCQLYIHGQCPSIDIATFFRISDKDIIKSYYLFHVNGREIAAGNTIQNDSIKKSYRDTIIENHFKEIVRDILWKYANWFNRDLRTWIEKQKPTCIFLAPGSSAFIYKIALKISEKYHLPIITYVCDDFFFYEYRKTILNKMWKKRLDKIAERCFCTSALIVAICDEISDRYSDYFGLHCETIMTGSTIGLLKNTHIAEEVKNVSYFGKLSLNRFLPLEEVCREVDVINGKTGKNIIVNIYSEQPGKEILTHFEDIKCVKFRGFLKGQEFVDAYSSSDVLLYVESFDPASKERVMKSISTKIADAMASGIPLLTYAPSGIASVNYLSGNGLCVATSNIALKEMVNAIIDPGYRAKLSSIQLRLAIENHNAATNSLRLHQLINEVQDKNENSAG